VYYLLKNFSQSEYSLPMVKRVAFSILTVLALIFSSSNFVNAAYPNLPSDLKSLEDKISSSLVILKWTGNKKGIGFAGDYNLSQEQKNSGINSIIVTNLSNLSESFELERSCFRWLRIKDVTLEYKGKQYAGTCQTFNSGGVDLATIQTSLNVPTIRLYDSYIPEVGQSLIAAYYVEGFGIKFSTTRIKLIDKSKFILAVEKFEPLSTQGGLVFNSEGNFVGVLTNSGIGSTPSDYFKVQGAPLQCQTAGANTGITNCPANQDKIWTRPNPGQISEPTPTPTPSPSLAGSAEMTDARNAAFDSVLAAKEAIDAVDSAVEECLSVSEEFLLDVQELYDSTNLSSYCETLEVKANLLRSKILALNPSQARTTDAANKITEQSNLFAEDADALVAQIQDITDELSGTDELLTSIIENLEPLNDAESEVIEAWDVLIERLARLPKTSQSVIQKSQSYKSSLVIVEQLNKTLTTRDTLYEKLSDLKDPRKLKTIASQFATLKVSTTQLLTFERSLNSINKAVPSKVCSKGLQTVLTSKSGTCPPGYKRVSTL
jgi:hypothetical protein